MPLSDQDQSAEIPARALVTLAENAALCCPTSCAAAATVGVEGGGPGDRAAVTHPDLAPLIALQLRSGQGPVPTAARTGRPAGSEDLLAERRWPAYRELALAAGLRSSTTLPFSQGGLTVTVTLCGFRTGAMDEHTRTAATLVGELATRTLASDQARERALTEVDQLDAALRSRPVIDQACGILMHLLGCDADAAFDLLRRQSQRSNSRLAELAEGVVRSRGRGLDRDLAASVR